MSEPRHARRGLVLTAILSLLTLGLLSVLKT